MNNLGGNLPLNNASNFGSLPSGPENSSKVGDTNMYGQANGNPVDYMQNQDFGNSGNVFYFFDGGAGVLVCDLK